MKLTAADFVDLADVEATPLERIVSGGPWDAAWGGGIVPTSVTLIGGKPGGGKTSLALKLANSIADVTGRKSLFVNVEMIGSEIRFVANRLRVKPGQIVIFRDFATTSNGDVKDFRNTPPAAMIIDSVSFLAGRDTHAAVGIAKRCKRYAVTHRVPCFLVAHVTKEAAFSGLMALQHEVDTLVTLTPEKQGLRILTALKNRYGPTHVKHQLLMTEAGLVAWPPPSERE